MVIATPEMKEIVGTDCLVIAEATHSHGGSLGQVHAFIEATADS